MPDDPSQLGEWLKLMGLEDAEVLAIFGNDELAELDREQLRMLHGLLEARWSIDHPGKAVPPELRTEVAEEKVAPYGFSLGEFDE